MTMEDMRMPIPLRPVEAVPMPTRRRPRVAPPLVAEIRATPAGVPLGVIRAEPMRGTSNAERVSDNDGWPCLPLAER